MSFFKKSLKALGFSEEEEEEYTQHTEREVAASPRTTANTGPAEPAAPAAPTNNGGETLPDSLLEHIVELINASLPDFVRTCIDRESEKRYIYEHLGDSFKNYIAELRGQARSTVEQEVAATRQKLEEELAAQRRKTAELEEQKNEIRNAQLSAERQKRALHDKVHDLDNRVATLEAEKEQYELENKSLLNKLKVADVKQHELDEVMSENTRLLGVIQELKNAHADESASAEIEELRQQAAQATASLDEAIQKAEVLSGENETLQRLIEEKERAISEKELMVEQIGSEKSSLLAACDELKTTNESLQRLIEEKEQAISEKEQIVEQIGSEKSSLLAACDELKTTNETLQRLIEEKEQAISEKEQIVEQIGSEKSSLLAAYDELKTTNEAQRSASQTLEQTQGELTKAHEELKEAQENIARLEENLAQEVLLRKGLEEKSGVLQSDLDTSVQRCNELETSLQKIQEGERAEQLALEESAAQLSELKNSYAALQQERNVLSAQNEEYKRQIERKSEEIEKAQAEAEQHVTRLASADAMIAELKKQSADAEAARTELAERDKRIAKLTEENAELSKFVELTGKVEEKINRYEEIETAKRRAERELAELRTRMEEVQQEADRWREEAKGKSSPADAEELRKAKEMIAALKKQRQELISQTATLRTQNKAYENQIAARETTKKEVADNGIHEDIKITFGNDSAPAEKTEKAAVNIDDCFNWMKPVRPDSLEEEKRRKEEEKRRAEEEEKARAAEKEARKNTDTSSQMSLW